MGAVLSLECERARLQASLRLDGELSEFEEASWRAHSGRCAACASFERELAALTGKLRAAPPERPAVGVRLPRRRSATVRVLQFSAAAAAVVLAAGLGSLAGSLSSPGSATTTNAASAAPAHGAAVIQRGLVAAAPDERLPVSRIRSAIAL
jgi:predicted anti-sigma-YlaC factor YlaD